MQYFFVLKLNEEQRNGWVYRSYLHVTLEGMSQLPLQVFVPFRQCISCTITKHARGKQRHEHQGKTPKDSKRTQPPTLFVGFLLPTMAWHIWNIERKLRARKKHRRRKKERWIKGIKFVKYLLCLHTKVKQKKTHTKRSFPGFFHFIRWKKRKPKGVLR